MHRKYCLVIVLIGLISTACEDAFAPNPTASLRFDGVDRRTDLGTLGGPTSMAYGLNDSGYVVGAADTDSGWSHAFIWSPEDGMVDLGTLPGGGASIARDVNNHGVVVGHSEIASGFQHAFIWTKHSGIQDIGSFDGPTAHSGAHAINDNAIVVGFSASEGYARAFKWDSINGMIDLGALPGLTSSIAYDVNESGMIVGHSSDLYGTSRAVVWMPGEDIVDIGLLPGGSYSVALAVNNDDVVAGYADIADGSLHAFTWTQADGLQDRGALPTGTVSAAFGINDSNEMVGFALNDSLGPYRAFAWDEANGMRDLGSLPGGNYAWAYRINNAGFAVGFSDMMGSGQLRAILWDVRTIFNASAAPDPLHAPDTIASWLYADSAAAVMPDSVSRYLKHVVVIGFHKWASLSQRQAVFDSVSGTVVGGFWQPGIDGAYYVRVPYGESIDSLFTVAGRVRQMPGVLEAFANIEAAPLYVRPNDGAGFLASDWQVGQDSVDGLKWGLEDINAPMAWGCSAGDATAPAAIVEVHEVTAQPDIVANVSPFYRTGLTRVGDPFLANDYNLGSHATRVASIIAAQGGNGAGMTGVMQRASIRLYDVGDPVVNLTAAPIIRAGREGALVINVSLGKTWRTAATPHYQPQWSNARDSAEMENHRATLRFAINTLRADNRYPLIILGAGNDGYDAEWAGYPSLKSDSLYADQLLVVAGLGKPPSSALRSQRTRYPGINNFGSNHGPLVDLMAPGDRVGTISQTGVVEAGSGTSFAAPFVTGTVGLLLSFDPWLQTLPGLQFAREVKRLLFAGADSSTRTATGTGGPYRILDAYESLREAARRQGAPICGNRVWVSGGSVQVERGAGFIDAIGTSGGAVAHLLDVQHGGREVSWFNSLFDPRRLIFQNGGWTGPHQSSPAGARPGATSGSLLLLSHDRDSTVTLEVRSDSALGVSADSLRVYVILADTSFSSPDTSSLELPSTRAGGLPCTPDVVFVETCAPVNGIWSLSGAYPSRGDTVLFVVNHFDVTRSAGAVPCTNDLQLPDICPWEQYEWRPEMAAIYSFALSSRQISLHSTVPQEWIYWLGASERGDEFVMARGNETFTLHSQTLDSRVLHSCRIQFRDRSLGSIRRDVVGVDGCPSFDELTYLPENKGGGTIAPKRSRYIRTSR